MTSSQKPAETDVRDWLLALVLAAPLLLAITDNFLATDLRATFQNYHLIIHYALYLAGLALVVFHLVQEVAQRRVPGFAGWAGRILAFTVMADIAAPFQPVAAFSVLKALFYLLILVQLARFLLVDRRDLRYSIDPGPFTVLLALTTLLFFQETFGSASVPGPENGRQAPGSASGQTAGVVIVVAMLLLTALQFLRWRELTRRRGLVVLTAGAGAFLLAGNAWLWAGGLTALASLWPSLTLPPALGVPLPFSARYLCLFLYLLALAHYDGKLEFSLPGRQTAFDLKPVVGFLFAAAFFCLYFQMNFAAIARALGVVREQQGLIFIWGSALLLALFVIVAGLGLVRARQAAGKALVTTSPERRPADKHS